MTGRPTVAVVIPTHDRREMLASAVASVLQERTVSLELIVVDDDSRDGTEAWLAKQDDPRLRYHVLRPGRLASGARNVGLADCTAPYVMFLDDDDVLRPGAIPVLLSALESHPTAVRVVGAHKIFGEGMRNRRGLHPRIPVNARPWKAELFRWNMPPAAMLWRTHIVREIGGWTEGLRRAEDAELCLRAWRWPARVIPTTVLDYRCHPLQAQTASTWPFDWEARRTFVETLVGRERRQAERILQSREISQVGLERYLERRYLSAAGHFARVIVRTPSTGASLMSGPWILGYLGKSLLGAAIPRRLAARISAFRRERRGAVPDTRRSPGATPPVT